MIDMNSLVTLPTYTTTSPSTGKQVQFRPFMVKEEKILLIAMESKDSVQITTAIKQILENCFFNKINIEDMPYFDTEYLFVQLRMRSLGEVVEIIIKDPKTEEKFDTTMALENVKIINLDKEKLNFDIKINNNFGIILKYPPISAFSGFSDEKEDPAMVFKLISKCVDKIYTKDEVLIAKEKDPIELENFIGSFTKEMFAKTLVFFNNMPKVIYEDVFVSPTTGNKLDIRVDNFRSFFR